MSDRQLSGLRSRRLGFVFQQFFLLDGLSVLDNVAERAAVPGRDGRRAPGAGPGGAGAGRAQPPAAAPAEPAVGRGTAAHRDRPGAGGPARPGDGRRADRQPGHRDRRVHPGAAARTARRRHHDRGHHPRPGCRRGDGRGASRSATGGSSVTRAAVRDRDARRPAARPGHRRRSRLTGRTCCAPAASDCAPAGSAPRCRHWASASASPPSSACWAYPDPPRPACWPSWASSGNLADRPARQHRLRPAGRAAHHRAGHGLAHRPGHRRRPRSPASPRSYVYRSPYIPAINTNGIALTAADPALPATLGATMAHGTFLNPATARYPAVVLGTEAASLLGIQTWPTPPRCGSAGTGSPSSAS